MPKPTAKKKPAVAAKKKPAAVAKKPAAKKKPAAAAKKKPAVAAKKKPAAAKKKPAVAAKKKPAEKVDEVSLIVRYGAIGDDDFPDVPLVGFPESWSEHGFEGAMINQPEWQTNNEYFSGPRSDVEAARASLTKLYDRFVKLERVSRYVIDLQEHREEG